MAENTPRLDLLKKDPVTDGADTFNIKTMLNDNWDKIDEKVAKKLDFDTHDQDGTRHVTSAEKTKLAGIEPNANNYTHPSSHPASMITDSSSRRFVSDSNISDWNAKETPVGAQSKADAAETNAINWTKSFGLGTNMKILGAVDVDTITETGFYYASSGSTNTPTGGSAYIIHGNYSSLSAYQIAIVSGRLYFRVKSTSWSAWSTVAFTDQDAWVNAVLQNGWTQGGSVVRYFKDQFGIVRIKGQATGGTKAAGTTLFTLPAGYRPDGIQYYNGLTFGASSSNVSITVSTSGEVKIQTAANDSVSFDGITFRAQ